MDYMYTFKQAHQDRLEDAGLRKYEAKDRFRALTAGENEQHTTITMHLQALLLAIVHVIVK